METKLFKLIGKIITAEQVRDVLAATFLFGLFVAFYIVLTLAYHPQ